MISIRNISAADVQTLNEQLVDLLQNTVDDGASIGFIAPLSAQDAHAYWQGVASTVAEGHKILLIAEEEGRLAGPCSLPWSRGPMVITAPRCKSSWCTQTFGDAALAAC